MSVSCSYSQKRGNSLSPGEHYQINSSYFEKSRELSSRFNELEDKISNLEEDCSSFRKELDSNQRMIGDEGRQIGGRVKKKKKRINTPQHPSPRTRAEDLIDYNDNIEPSSYDHLSRKKLNSDSTLLTSNGVNHDGSYAKVNNNSNVDTSQNSQMTIPKPNFSAIYENNSFLNNSYNSDNYNSDNYDKYNNDVFTNSFNNNSFNNDNSPNNNKNQSMNDSDSSFEFSHPVFNQNFSNRNTRYYNNQTDQSPVLSESMQMYKKDEADLNQQVDEMRNKILEIDSRVSEAQKILSVPIGDIETDQKITENAERSLINIQNRLSSFEDIDNNFEDYSEMINDIEFIESQNDKRTKELNIKRKRLDEMRSLILRIKVSNNSRIQSRSTFFSKNRSYRSYSSDNKGRYSSNLSSELAMRKIDESHAKLKKRSLCIQDEEGEIDRYENELIQKRKDMEQNWKLKMKKIERLSAMRREIDRLKLDIHVKETEIDQLTGFLNELENERLKITKNIAITIEKSTRRMSYYPQDCDEKRARLNQKQRHIDSMARKLKDKRRKINKFEESVRKSIICMKLYNDQVEHMEAQVEEMGRTTEEQLEDLQRETTQLSRSLATLRSPPNKKNSYQQNKSGDNTEEFFDLDNYD